MMGCSWFRSLVGNSPAKSHRLAEAARSAEESGRIPQAITLLEEALEETPDDPHFHRELARLLRSQGQWSRAQEHLKQAVAHNPNDVEANVELAEISLQFHQPSLAVEHVKAALQNDPKNLKALLLRAKLAEFQGDPQTAIETYQRVLSIDPHHVEARVRIAAIQLENHQPSLAAPLLRSVCQSSRATPEEVTEARLALGVAYGQERRWSDAVETLSAAGEEGDGLSADAWYRLAYARSRLGDWEGVRHDLNEALRIKPRHENALTMLDVLRSKQDSPKGSILRIGHSIKPIPVPELW